MADTKISDLPAVTDVISTDEYVLARAGATKKIDAIDLFPMARLYDSTLGSPGSFDVSSIPGTYKHLKLMFYGKGTAAAAGVLLSMRFNNDSGSNYDTQWVQTYGTTTAPNESIGGTSLVYALEMPGTTAPASAASQVEILIANYASTAFHKTASWNGAARLTSGTTGMRNTLGAGLWRNTAAITRIQLFAASGSVATDSRLTIYGLN